MTACTVPATSNSPDKVTVESGDASAGANGAGSAIARKHCNAWGKAPARPDGTAENGSGGHSYTCQ
jgi:hypothetical protein